MFMLLLAAAEDTDNATRYSEHIVKLGNLEVEWEGDLRLEPINTHSINVDTEQWNQQAEVLDVVVRAIVNGFQLATAAGPMCEEPLWGVLFVVEEAATHFSVPLLWRAFSAAYVSMYTTHLIDRLRSGEFNGRGEFQVTFEPGTGEDCDFYDLDFVFVVILGAICGAAGALFNASIVRLRRWRQRVLGGGVCARAAQAAFVSVLTAGTCAALSAALPCVPRSVGQLEYAHFDGSNPGGCAPPYGQCGGDGWGGPTCCTGPDWTCEDKSQYFSQCTPSGSTTRAARLTAAASACSDTAMPSSAAATDDTATSSTLSPVNCAI